jgi:3-oxoacyl-[acyl-carrier protein] reductase
VADPAQCAELVTKVEERLGPIEILVNNAGITRDNILVRLKDEDWEAVMNTNLRGAFNATRAVARGMMKRRSGRIISISSVVGLTGNRGQANYAASKAGLIGFTKSVALELAARGILANVVAPGFIETDMTAGLPDEAREALFERISLGRLGTPSDVAGAVRFLAGPAAAYITGQVLVVDGGMAM